MLQLLIDGMRQICCTIKLVRAKNILILISHADDKIIFKNFQEDWEQVTISFKLNTNEFHFLQTKARSFTMRMRALHRDEDCKHQSRMKKKDK